MLNDIVNNGFQTATQAKEAKPATPAVVASDQPEETDSAAQAEEQQQKAQAEPAELQSAVSKLNDYVQNIQRTLAFSVEENTGVTVVQVYDTETEELIRQIPAEETIKLAASIEAQAGSLFLKEQA